jgi:hypothetical protein
MRSLTRDETKGYSVQLNANLNISVTSSRDCRRYDHIGQRNEGCSPNQRNFGCALQWLGSGVIGGDKLFLFEEVGVSYAKYNQRKLS